ncbi:MAG TPA: heparan-alpha-glucosaminide N-acetyltransferase [Clostridia bacterium]|nr:heparan-alpha-glucosaminide N-acetyltransferase [Clostridia bacterium]
MDSERRIWEIDFLRGFAIICMIFDHIMFDFAYVFTFTEGILGHISEFAAVYMNLTARAILQNVFLVIFVGVSGISSSLSRSNYLRGFKLLAVALFLSLATYLMGEGYFIKFGILHMLAVSIILYAVLQRVNNIALVIIGILIVAVGIIIEVKGIKANSNILMPLGIHAPGFSSADYYPLLPWSGVFFIGAVTGKNLYRNKASLLPQFKGKRWHKPFAFAGRHALVIYLLHQPDIWLLLYLTALILGYDFFS